MVTPGFQSGCKQPGSGLTCGHWNAGGLESKTAFHFNRLGCVSVGLAFAALKVVCFHLFLLAVKQVSQ